MFASVDFRRACATSISAPWARCCASAASSWACRSLESSWTRSWFFLTLAPSSKGSSMMRAVVLALMRTLVFGCNWPGALTISISSPRVTGSMRTAVGLAEALSQVAEAIAVLGQLDRQPHVFIFICCDQLRQFHIGQQADTDAAGMRIPAQRDDREAHPHCLAGGRGPIVREGVQGDVHFCVSRQVIGGSDDVAGEVEAGTVDAVAGETVGDAFFCCFFGQGSGFEKQACG